MALLFSAVTVTANDQEVEFLVGGIPREFDDLEGWTAFDNFMEDIDEETESEAIIPGLKYASHSNVSKIYTTSPSCS